MASSVDISAILNSDIMPDVLHDLDSYISKFVCRLDRAIAQGEIVKLEKIGFKVMIYTKFNPGICNCDYGASSGYMCNHLPSPVTTNHTVISLNPSPYIGKDFNDSIKIKYLTK